MAFSVPLSGRSHPQQDDDDSSRKIATGGFTIEEILPDDMGYDADIETIKPDRYEDAESETEDMASPNHYWQDVDEELAARMIQLGRDQLPPLRSSADQGRKRRSTEMGDDDTLLCAPRSPQLEVQELLDGQSMPSPAKRRKKKNRRPSMSRHIPKHSTGIWTDSSEKTDSNDRTLIDDASSQTESACTTPRREQDDEMMDMT